MLGNHSKFPPISDEEFLAGTRVLAALKKIRSSYLKRDLRRENVGSWRKSRTLCSPP